MTIRIDQDASRNISNLIAQYAQCGKRKQRVVTGMLRAQTASCFSGRTQQPLEVQAKVTAVFEELSSRAWYFNGDFEYRLGGVDEHQLVRALIQQTPPERKNFYVMDLGAGDGSWGKKLAFVINQEKHLKPDLVFHIMNVRGELFKEQKIVHSGCCRIYQLGGFKIEELSSEFKKLGFPVENNIDLLVSRWCLRHLVHPVRTFVQGCNLLRPGTGLFLFDGFFFLHENDSFTKYFQGEKPHCHMIQLLLDAKFPFLIRPYDQFGSLDQFILRRPNSQSCRVPMGYRGMETLLSANRLQIGSNTVLRFKTGNRELIADDIDWPPFGCYRGDGDLYNWLDSRTLIPERTWFHYGLGLTREDQKQWAPILKVKSL